MQPLQPNIEAKWYIIPAAFNKCKNNKWNDSCKKCEYQTGRANLSSTAVASERYSRHNNIELSVIRNDIPEDNLEKVEIDICHDSGFKIEPKDVEGRHHFPVSRCSRDSNKRVIIKFVNRKHPEVLLRNKEPISSKDFSKFNCLW